MEPLFTKLQRLESALELYQRIVLTDSDPFRISLIPNACSYYIKEAERLLGDPCITPYQRQKATAVLTGFTRLKSPAH